MAVDLRNQRLCQKDSGHDTTTAAAPASQLSGLITVGAFAHGVFPELSTVSGMPDETTQHNDRLLSGKELRDYLGVSHPTFQLLLKEGLPCLVVSLGSQRPHRRFDRHTVVEWLQKRQLSETSGHK